MKAGVPLDCCKWGFKRLWAFVTAGDGLGLALPYSSLSLSPTQEIPKGGVAGKRPIEFRRMI